MRKTINTNKAPAAIGPYEQANIYENLVFTSGQIPLDPESGNIVGSNVEQQAHQVFKNMGEILKASGAEFETVLKTTVFIKNMDDFTKINEVYAQYFAGEMLPSRSAVEVARLPKDVLIEAEAIAYRRP